MDDTDPVKRWIALGTLIVVVAGGVWAWWSINEPRRETTQVLREGWDVAVEIGIEINDEPLNDFSPQRHRRTVFDPVIGVSDGCERFAQFLPNTSTASDPRERAEAFASRYESEGWEVSRNVIRNVLGGNILFQVVAVGPAGASPTTRAMRATFGGAKFDLWAVGGDCSTENYLSTTTRIFREVSVFPHPDEINDDYFNELDD